jgi:hypothetical protein
MNTLEAINTAVAGKDVIKTVDPEGTRRDFGLPPVLEGRKQWVMIPEDEMQGQTVSIDTVENECRQCQPEVEKIPFGKSLFAEAQESEQ